MGDVLSLNSAHLKNFSVKFKVHLFHAKLTIISSYQHFPPLIFHIWLHSRLLPLSRLTSGCNNFLSFPVGRMLSWEDNILLPALHHLFSPLSLWLAVAIIQLNQADRKMIPWNGISGELGPFLGLWVATTQSTRTCGGWTLGLLFGTVEASAGPSDPA